jgi:plasmid stabilization system protein ParE
MPLRWTEAAAADLERIADYLFEHTPERAPRLVRTFYETPSTLLTFRTGADRARRAAPANS